MKMKRMYIPTLRDDPSDAETSGHKLLVRGAYLRKTDPGVYAYLPLGLKVLRKIEKLVIESMAEANFQEILLPSLSNLSFIEQTEGTKRYGSELIKFRDRNSIPTALNPSFEEVIMNLIKGEVKSYKQLPLNFYSTQSVFRDEERPRFGIGRAREFKATEAFLIAKDEDALKDEIKNLSKVYENIFEKLGLNVVTAEAHPELGGKSSLEFIAVTAAGDEGFCHDLNGGEASTLDAAEVVIDYDEDDVEVKEIKWIETPGCITIEDVSKYLEVPASHCAKALDLMVKNKPVLVMIPGDRELSMAKLTRYLGVAEEDITMMMDYDIIELLGSKPGFTGPKDIKKGVRVVLDERVTKMKNLVIGTNEVNSHFINANFGRDFQGEIAKDLVTIREGDICKSNGDNLTFSKGFSIGKITDSGDYYSKILKAAFLNENGKEQNFNLGIGSLGISRIMNAIAEQHHDEKGIVWPVSMAPYEAIVTIVNTKVSEQNELAEKIYSELKANGVDVILDDRDERAGVKFNDRDLIGIPYRITVGKDAVNDNVEFSTRRDMENTVLSSMDAINNILQELKK